MKKGVSFITGVALGFILLWISGAYFQRTSFKFPPKTTIPKNIIATSTQSVLNPKVKNNIFRERADGVISNTTSRFQVRNQRSGKTVVINSVVLTKNSWVAVHKERDGFVERALGIRFIRSGIHNTITIPLLYPTIAGTRYWIVLYTDNGDYQFSVISDKIIYNNVNEPIIQSFIAQ